MLCRHADLTWLLNRLRRLPADEGGSSLPLMAALMIPLVAFVGLATDAARGYVVKTRLHDALDAAALAGAHEVFSENFEGQLESYFRANFPTGYMGAKVELGAPRVSANRQVVSIDAQATIGTTFTRVLGFETLRVSTTTEVTRQTASLDVVIAIDMSGSMNLDSGSGGKRIEAARTAANTLVEILYGNAERKDLLKVGLVPWNGKVNVTLNGGGAYDPALIQTIPVESFRNPESGLSQSEVYLANNSPVPLLEIPPADWPGCVYARYEKDGRVNDADIHLATGTFDNKEWMGWQPNSDPSSDCLSHGITPLRSGKSGILDAIAELTTPVHATNIPQGLAWSWRVLSPVAPFEEAEVNPKGDHKRAIVLLTDGENQGWDGDGYDAAFGSGTRAGPNGMDSRLRSLAANIKSEGVRIFAIQFYHDTDRLRGLMQDVATQPNAPYYHFAPDGEALEAAFEEVADELSALRISR